MNLSPKPFFLILKTGIPILPCQIHCWHPENFWEFRHRLVDNIKKCANITLTDKLQTTARLLIIASTGNSDSYIAE